jgi:hypothetical protein
MLLFPSSNNFLAHLKAGQQALLTCPLYGCYPSLPLLLLTDNISIHREGRLTKPVAQLSSELGICWRLGREALGE